MKIAIHTFNGILDNLYYEVKNRGDLESDWQRADVVVVWQDAIGVLSTMCKQAKELGKKVVVAEHGLLSVNDYLPPLSKPLVGDTFMAWGQKTKEILLPHISQEKIAITGSTIFSRLGSRVPHEGKNVLFAPRHWGDDDIPENMEVAEVIKNYKDAYIYSKIIVGEHDPFKYPHPIMSQRNVNNHITICYDALKVADVVVGIGEGTFASLAYWMDIPYISVDNWQTKDLLGKSYTKEDFNSQLSYASRKVELKDLRNAIDEELAHPESMSELRSKFVIEYLDGGDPAKALEKQLHIVYD